MALALAVAEDAGGGAAQTSFPDGDGGAES